MKTLYPISTVLQVGDEVMRRLEPYVHRMQYVGSLGRQEGKIKDIDILVEPTDIRSIRQTMEKMGEWNRGGDRMMSINKTLGSGISTDLFLCHPPAQWGVITACRLNPIPLVIYGKSVIDNYGYRRENGTIFRTHVDGEEELSIPRESNWFDLIDLPHVPANQRWELTRELRLI